MRLYKLRPAKNWGNNQRPCQATQNDPFNFQVSVNLRSGARFLRTRTSRFFRLARFRHAHAGPSTTGTTRHTLADHRRSVLRGQGARRWRARGRSYTSYNYYDIRGFVILGRTTATASFEAPAPPQNSTYPGTIFSQTPICACGFCGVVSNRS